MSEAPKEKIKALYISDLHIGSPACQCNKFLDFLDRYEFQELFLVGDIFDGDAIKRSYKWTSCYSQFISRIIQLGKKIKIFYVPGNHDDFMREYVGECIKDLCIYRDVVITRSTDSVFVTHGDEIDPDYFARNHLYSVGGRLYGLLLWANRWLCKIGLGCFWTKRIKRQSKRAINFITDFEERAAALAKAKQCGKIILGHVHIPEIKDIDGIKYMNCGDWVENCSGIIEDLDNNFRIEYYDSASLRGPELLEQR